MRPTATRCTFAAASNISASNGKDALGPGALCDLANGFAPARKLKLSSFQVSAHYCGLKPSIPGHKLTYFRINSK